MRLREPLTSVLNRKLFTRPICSHYVIHHLCSHQEALKVHFKSDLLMANLFDLHWGSGWCTVFQMKYWSPPPHFMQICRVSLMLSASFLMHYAVQKRLNKVCGEWRRRNRVWTSYSGLKVNVISSVTTCPVVAGRAFGSSGFYEAREGLQNS